MLEYVASARFMSELQRLPNSKLERWYSAAVFLFYDVLCSHVPSFWPDIAGLLFPCFCRYSLLLESRCALFQSLLLVTILSTLDFGSFQLERPNNTKVSNRKYLRFCFLRNRGAFKLVNIGSILEYISPSSDKVSINCNATRRSITSCEKTVVTYFT